jgi:hypothetical protein
MVESIGGIMARFKVLYYSKRTGKVTESEVWPYHPPVDPALFAKSKVVTLVRDNEGADHPANAGKFFLDRILK